MKGLDGKFKAQRQAIETLSKQRTELQNIIDKIPDATDTVEEPDPNPTVVEEQKTTKENPQVTAENKRYYDELADLKTYLSGQRRDDTAGIHPFHGRPGDASPREHDGHRRTWSRRSASGLNRKFSSTNQVQRRMQSRTKKKPTKHLKKPLPPRETGPAGRLKV